MKVYMIPKLGSIGGELGQGLGTIGVGASVSSGGALNFGPIFIATIVVQGLFAGLMLGKFSEGDYTSGIKHSLIMVIGGYLLITTIMGLVEPAHALILLIPSSLIMKRKYV